MNMNTGTSFVSGTGSVPAQQPPVQPPPPSGEGAQQFCLRWNSYPATVATQLAALRNQEDFVDVTLACDGRQLKAHKLVLSACSPYFMQLFKSTPCQHPVIFLRDVGFRQLVALLEFMYAGEVNVSQAELPALLRTAEALQVRGLADTTANNNNNTPCPPQQPKPAFPPQYGDQMVGQTVMNNTLSQPGQLPIDQNGCLPCTPTDIPLIPAQAQQMNTAPVVSSSAGTAMLSNNSPMPINSRRERNSQSAEGGCRDKTGSNSQSSSSGFEMMNPMDHNMKDENYITDGNSNVAVPGQMEEPGQIFPDEFDMGDADNDHIENQTDEESSEVSEDEDGDAKEYTYHSDASYSHEGMSEGDGPANGEGSVSGSAGPSTGHSSENPGSLPNKDGHGLPSGSGNERKNRLSRSLWPPGIPYHGPQQCPYCTRVLSNVGNWRKHVLTMHFAREKVYKCRHCTSAFRTAEYLQKHYVRVHNYPQKMTRRKYGSGQQPEPPPS